MYTRCPSCQSLFRIQAQQLKAARGQVRCGECGTPFDALEFLVNRDELSDSERRATADESRARQWALPFDEEVPPPGYRPPGDEQGAPAASAGRFQEALSAAQIELLLAPEHEAASEEETPGGVAGEVPPPPLPEPAPREAVEEGPAPESVASEPDRPRYALPEHAPAPRSGWATFGWTLGSLAMVALLLGQLAIHHRERLAANPQWRAPLERLCALTGCALPQRREPGSIEMVERTVLSHPRYQNALMIRATLVNKAPFAQPYPAVELTMTDLEQKRVAVRRFLPEEYLAGPPPARLLSAGGSAQLQLEIADPGDEAVGFEFDFF